MGDSDYESYSRVVSDIIDRYVDPELQQSSGFLTPDEEFTTPSEILGFRDGTEMFFRRIASGKLLLNKAGKVRTKEEKIFKLFKFLKNINAVDIKSNKIVKIKPFFKCQKCCKRCIIGTGKTCYTNCKYCVMAYVESYVRAYACTIF